MLQIFVCLRDRKWAFEINAEMTVAALVIDVAVVGILSAILLHRYGNWRKQHVLVTIATFIAWYFSFMIIFVLPIDVSNVSMLIMPFLVAAIWQRSHNMTQIPLHCSSNKISFCLPQTCYRQCLKDHASPLATTLAFPDGNQSQIDNITEPITTRETTTLSNVSGSTPISSIAPQISGKSLPVGDAESYCKQSWSHVPPDILPNLWHVVYWTSQALTWLILPIMQSYATAGDFTILGKIKTALIANAVYYSSYLLIFIVCLIYVAVKPNLHINGWVASLCLVPVFCWTPF